MVAWWRAANHGGMTVTSNKQIAEELITALFTNGDLTAVDLNLDPDLVDHDRPLPDSPYWPEGMRQPGRVSATPYLVPAGTYRASVMGEPPNARNVVSAGSRSSASPTARSSSAGDPNGDLDLAPDRRRADLELGGADRAAVAQ